jgi:excinuclease UvrABC ATPase subunit
MEGKCGNCQGTGNVTFSLGMIGHTQVRCAVCHGTGHFNLTTHQSLFEETDREYLQ